MTDGQLDFYNKIKSVQEQLVQLHNQYWNSYSNMSTWQFWFLIILFITPLVVLYLSIDRKHILLIGFYGLNLHVWFTYMDLIGVRNGLWGYIYRFFPFLPQSVTVDTSLLPVTLMLVYQWTLKHNKNFYIYSICTAFILACAFKPLLSLLNFYRLDKGITYLHIFIFNTIVVLISRIITNIFVSMQKKALKD